MPPTLIDWSQVDHVLLDMDGTVLDLAYDNHFWQEVLPARYAEQHGLSLEQAHARLTPEFDGTQGTLAWYCLDHWTRVTGLDIATIKRETRDRIRPLPGAEEFLHAVRASGREIWLATNAHPGSWQLKLAETGFHEHFDRVLSSHDFGVPKEDARFWPRLRERHAFDPSRTLFADDSLPVLCAARAYGIAKVIAIRKPDSRHPPRELGALPAVDHLSELLPIG
jgi:putative hydrolase of the HAD superfamily